MTYTECLNQETTCQSQYSPNLVQNSEYLARLIMSPKHFQDGEVDATAFEQIFEGMSVIRKDLPSFEKDSIKLIEILSRGGEQTYVGYVRASVEEIRSFLIGIYRLFYIVDTAREYAVAHADIHAIRTTETRTASGMPKTPFNKFIRSEIADIFNKNGFIDNSTELKALQTKDK